MIAGPPVGEPARQFPIQQSRIRLASGAMGYVGLSSIPWAMIAPHEGQAQRNHDQTLQQLANRAGLCACEATAVLQDRPWRQFPDHREAEQLLVQLVNDWKFTHEPV